MSIYLLALLAGLPGLIEAQQPSAAVYISNRSAVTIENIYLSPVGSDKWGEDRLGDRTLLAGGRIALDPGLANGCSYDLRIVYADKEAEERRNQNLCELEEIAFGGAADIDTAIDIVNASSLMIHFIYVSPTGSANWGRDWLGADTGMRAGARGKINPGKDAGCHFDVRVVYENKQTEERRNQNLCELTEVVFAGAAAAPAPAAAADPVAVSYGTGFFVTGEGHALTNHHVAKTAARSRC